MEYVKGIPGELDNISRRTKEISSYWMVSWIEHQRALKLLICLHKVAIKTFRWSISDKNVSIKINAILVWILITCWFGRTLDTIHNLLLLQDKYLQIQGNALCGATKMQHHLRIPTWCLVWNQTLKNILEDPQQYI